MGHWIADRFHVAWSDRTVIRETRNMLKPESRRDPSKRETRRDLYRAVLEAHHENQQLVIDWRL